MNMFEAVIRGPSSVVSRQSRLLVFVAALAVMFFVTEANAVINEPDNLVWGNVLVGGKVVGASETNIVVEARRSLTGASLASYRMGENPAAGSFYSLAIPLESTAPINDPNATRTGETILILVHNGQFVRYLTLYTVGERGKILRVDLGDVDTDNNGLIDNWERQHFGAAGQDANGDPDRDGVSNRNEMLGGTNPLLPDARHPADVNPTNNVMTIHEVTAYSLAWKTGKSWPVAPTNIPVDFVARAGFLWKNGEKYIMDTNALALGAPLWWTNLPPATNSAALASATPKRFAGKSAIVPASVGTIAETSRIVRSLGQPKETSWPIRLTVTPAERVSAYVVEESIQGGQGVVNIDSDGVFDATAGKVRWGPFFDHEQRNLTYHVLKTTQDLSGIPLVGVGSFDGSSVAITGESVLTTTGELRLMPLHLSANGSLRLMLRGEIGQRYSIEVSADLKNWSSVATLTAGEDGLLEFGENTSRFTGPRFYRARRLEQ